MTANQTHPSNGDVFASLLAAGGQAMRLVGKVFLAVMIVLAASVVAFATAIAGLFLAAAALVIRFTGSRRRPPKPGARPNGDPLTLDARRTAHGWTVE